MAISTLNRASLLACLSVSTLAQTNTVEKEATTLKDFDFNFDKSGFDDFFAEAQEKFAEQLEEFEDQKESNSSGFSSSDAWSVGEDGNLQIDFLTAWDEINSYFESDEFQAAMEEAFALIEVQLEKNAPELQGWFDDNWQDSWVEGSDDRWDVANLETGWDLDQIQEEFDFYFAENDPNLITDGGENQKKFEYELMSTMNLYDQGLASGKIEDDAETQQDATLRFQKLYDLALLSANESSTAAAYTSDADELAIVKQDQQVTLEEDGESVSDTTLIIAIVVIAALALCAMCILAYFCCIRDSRSDKMKKRLSEKRRPGNSMVNQTDMTASSPDRQAGYDQRVNQVDLQAQPGSGYPQVMNAARQQGYLSRKQNQE